ncbi:MAG: AMP-binding protein, partial [Verrucomicrobiota bacterium]
RAVHDEDATALTFLERRRPSRSLSYAELIRQANGIAHRIRETVETHHPRVLIQYPPGLDFVAALLGCWTAGATAVPAYPPRASRHADRLDGIIDHCQPHLALSDQTFQDRIAQLLRESSHSCPVIDPTGKESATPPEPNGNGPALIQYTSGSTGQPSGVVLTHDHLLANIRAIHRQCNGTPGAAVSWLPPYHDMGLVSMILFPLTCGFESVLMSPFSFIQNPLSWLEAISSRENVFAGAPNFAFELCIRRIDEDQKATLRLQSWKRAFCGAERIQAATLQRFSDHFGPSGFQPSSFHAAYGLAEATLIVSSGPVDLTLSHNTLTPCGHPIDQTSIRIIDPETQAVLPAGEEGEICVRGPGVGLGYFDLNEGIRPFSEVTFSSQEPWLRTGDLGSLQNDGQLVVAGRIKDLIILEGENHHPQDIEKIVLNAHPDIASDGTAAFSTVADGAESFALAVELVRQARASTAEIFTAISNALATHLHLRAAAVTLVPLRHLPRTSSGKIQRYACRQLQSEGWPGHLDSSSSSAAEEDFSDHDEAQITTICRIIGQVFERPPVDPRGDFFEMGGQSLTATRIASRLSVELNRKIPIRWIFDAPTPIRLSAKLNATPAQPLEDIESVDPAILQAPLTHSQKRMWFQYLSDEEGSAYNVAGGIDIRGPLDLTAARAAIQALLTRHRILRARYQVNEGQPVQEIEDTQPTSELHQDLSGKPDPEEAARLIASRMASLPFDLADDRLHRFRILQLSKDHFRFITCFHHIVIDGWSLGVLLKDFLAFYKLSISGTPPEPRPSSAFLTFARAQAARLGSAEIDRQRDWWRAHLNDAPDSLALPWDRPPGSQPSARGAVVKVPIPPSLIEDLELLSRQRQSSLFITMLAAFHALLARSTGQRDIVTGTPVANRNREESEDLIGSLVNTLPLRLDNSDDPTLEELLHRARSAVLDAQDHQDIPLEEIVEAVSNRREGQRDLFRVMFDYQNITIPPEPVAGLRLRPWTMHREESQFDLSLFVLDTGSEHLASFEYQTELFDRPTIERLASHFIVVLEQLSTGPQQRLTRFPLLTENERIAVLETPNQTASDYEWDKTFLTRFDHHVSIHPDQVVLTLEGEKRTWKELSDQSNQLARFLQSQRIGSGNRVAVYLERTPTLLISLLGILRAGAAYIPLDPEFPDDRITRILGDATPTALISQGSQPSTIPEAVRLINLTEMEETLTGFSAAPVRRGPRNEDLAYLIYTSGSTGNPKGVEVTHQNLHNFLHAMTREPGFGPADHLLAVTTVSFDISALELFLPLYAGGQLYLASRQDALDGQKLAHLIESTGANCM